MNKPTESVPAPELQPCPFCGIVPALRACGSGYFEIACINNQCGCLCVTIHGTQAKVTAVWNTRPA